MTSIPPSTLESHLGYWLRCLSNFVSQGFAERIMERDLSVGAWVVMRVLYDAPSIGMNETAEAVGVDKSSLSRMVERLVQRGLVSREPGEDRRSVRLALTREGKRLVPQLAKLADANDAAFFGSLSAKKKAELLGTIRQLLAANGWDARGLDKPQGA